MWTISARLVGPLAEVQRHGGIYPHDVTSVTEIEDLHGNRRFTKCSYPLVGSFGSSPRGRRPFVLGVGHVRAKQAEASLDALMSVQ